MNNKLSNNQISSIKDFYIKKNENDIKKRKFIINQKLKTFFKKKFDKINILKNDNLFKISELQENN